MTHNCLVCMGFGHAIYRRDLKTSGVLWPLDEKGGSRFEECPLGLSTAKSNKVRRGETQLTQEDVLLNHVMFEHGKRQDFLQSWKNTKGGKKGEEGGKVSFACGIRKQAAKKSME